ncbi:hypothetical protein [Synechococcus sp. MU1648]|uniref:hypothetical protein n=1 Tax=Synechococcus sp. MU1648 TaxID=2508351 RepID=UPI001D3DA94E|nr:hypothetical protein [Synechococcus sp. MU1648]MCB4377545.1 hypothetical protein [Synechococcus sp. MU1650]
MSCTDQLCGDRWSHPDPTDRRHFNQCVETIETVTGKPLNGIGAVAVCNGRPGADVVIVD